MKEVGLSKGRAAWLYILLRDNDQGSHYHGLCFLLLCLVGLFIRGQETDGIRKVGMGFCG